MSLTDVLVPVAATVLSGGLTWRFCLRPMRNGGHCGASPGPVSEDDAGASAARATEIAALRAQVRELSDRAGASTS